MSGWALLIVVVARTISGGASLEPDRVALVAVSREECEATREWLIGHGYRKELMRCVEVVGR